MTETDRVQPTLKSIHKRLGSLVTIGLEYLNKAEGQPSDLTDEEFHCLEFRVDPDILTAVVDRAVRYRAAQQISCAVEKFFSDSDAREDLNRKRAVAGLEPEPLLKGAGK